MDSIQKKVILIVDDVPENIEILSLILSKKYRIKVATNGFKALDIIRTPNDPPDLILLDIMMPLMDGYDVCRALKEDPVTKDIPVIFLTALTNQVDEFTGLELGAIDYITKPFIPRAIELRIQNHLTLQATRQELECALTNLKEAQRHEVEIATEIQQTLLIGHPPNNIQGAQIAAFTQASLGVDGDFFDFFPINSWTFDILFGDVMGKGIPAGLVGAATKSNFQRAMARLLVASPKRILPTPEAIVNQVRVEMTAPLLKVERFVSLHYARFDLKKHLLDLVVCGQTPLLRLRASGKGWEEIHSMSAPLGIIINENETYQQLRIAIEPGDFFLFFSDGAIDARNPSGEFFGPERLRESINAHLNDSPQQMLEALHRELEVFAQSTSFSDDLTFIAIKL